MKITLLHLIIYIGLHLDGLQCGEFIKGDLGLLEEIGLTGPPSLLTADEDIFSRHKRRIHIPSGATFTTDFNLKIPALSKLDGNLTGQFSAKIRVRYTFTESVLQFGKGRLNSLIDTERLEMYSFITSILESYGFEGHDCTLKLICEAANMDLTEVGLLGEFIAMMLSPNHNMESAREDLQEYSEAELKGREMTNCSSAFSECPLIELKDLMSSGLSFSRGFSTNILEKKRRRRNYSNLLM